MSAMAIEMIPDTEAVTPPPPPEDMSDPGDDLWCFMCLGGTCIHSGAASGHAVSAVTLLKGTALCVDCAQHLRNLVWYR